MRQNFQNSDKFWKSHPFVKQLLPKVIKNLDIQYLERQHNFTWRKHHKKHICCNLAVSVSPCCIIPCSKSLRPSCSASVLVVASPSWMSQSMNSDATKVRSYLTPSSSLACRRVFSELINLVGKGKKMIRKMMLQKNNSTSILASLTDTKQTAVNLTY